MKLYLERREGGRTVKYVCIARCDAEDQELKKKERKEFFSSIKYRLTGVAMPPDAHCLTQGYM